MFDMVQESLWLNTDSDRRAAETSQAASAEHVQTIESNTFWADEIKALKDDPPARLAMASRHLPMPGAFKECAIALRALIRVKRTSGESWEHELRQLYWLAGIDSLMVPYAKHLSAPGFNVMAAIPGQRIRAIAVDYARLGHERLQLLNKTDRGWIEEAWGEPDRHSTLHQDEHALWDEYEQALIQVRGEESIARTKELRAMLQAHAEDEESGPNNSAASNRGCGAATVLFLAATPPVLYALAALSKGLLSLSRGNS